MKYVLVLTGIVCTSLCFAVTVDTIPASDTLIEYTGRIDFTNPGEPTFSYSGVSIRACFTGTSIAMIMNDNVGQNFYNLILDGRLLDTVKITKGKKTYKIAEDLKDTIHEIELFKRTEEMFGKTQFFGFVVDQGASLNEITTDKRIRLMEYIGNSITCGYGDEGILGQTFGPTTEDHYMTYAAITSRNFNARHLAVCKSGIGIYRNYNGPAAGNPDCMTNYYTRIFLYDENPKYSFAEKPDLVCINLGTNDFSTTGGDSANYVCNYFRLIDTIQTKYNMPDIVCLLGPMLSGSTLSNIRRYLEFIADSANRKGNGTVSFFEMSAQTGDLGIAIDYHPTVAQHQRNAQELTEFIRSLKGWKVTPLVISAHIINTRHLELMLNTPVHDSLNLFSGLTLNNDTRQYSVGNIYSDSTNGKILHILFQENLSPGEDIYLNYIPGTIESEDSVMLGKVNSFEIKNTLTETKITEGSTSNNGAKVMLTFNKTIKKNSTIDGLTLTNNYGVIVIDSFSIALTQLTLYLHSKISRNDSVFAAYNGAGLAGEDEIPLSSFSKLVIKNNSRYTGIPETASGSLNIFPNPNHNGMFYYNLNSPAVTGKEKLDVFNGNGILIYNLVLSKPEGQIDLCDKPAKGVYFFRFILSDSVITKSLLIE